MNERRKISYGSWKIRLHSRLEMYQCGLSKCVIPVLIFMVCFSYYTVGLSSANLQKAKYRNKMERWLNEIDAFHMRFNSVASLLTWQTIANTKDGVYFETNQTEVLLLKNRWRSNICAQKIRTDWLTEEQKRKFYLFCRGGKYEDNEIILYYETMGALSNAYNSEICLPVDEDFSKTYNEIFQGVSHSIPKPGDCVFGEPDLENLMKNPDLSPEQLKWVWNIWHDSVGPRVKEPFFTMVKLVNAAAENSGYRDNGEVWREELEIQNLEETVEELYRQIEPLYKYLHAVMRHKLHKKYGSNEIDSEGPIPIHLLGNMWGQDWSNLMDLLDVENLKKDLNNEIKSRNLTIEEMVLEAEDFYVSMGFPKMTDKFWKYSIFEKKRNMTFCHGTAANLFNNGDFRMLMCGEPNMYGFYVIHHEMGHVEYYMAYEKQPSLFQDGTNTAFHESIGDAIMHGVMTPQHLQRLSLLSDQKLFDGDTELNLILLQALEKIPEIPFALLIDKYRWKIFRGDIPLDQVNKVYWDMNRHYRGIIPPENRNEKYFDIGAKFHVPDGTPYIRYFLSGILQIDIFKSLCAHTLLGRNPINSFENSFLPLQRCDIYGSKKAGEKLRSVLALGSSIHWSTALELLTDHRELTTKPFLEYYEPVFKWLEEYIQRHNVHVGW